MSMLFLDLGLLSVGLNLLIGFNLFGVEINFDCE